MSNSRVGLVHGRFQPFHRGHSYLVNKMKKECGVSVVLIGSVQLNDERNPLSYETRYKQIRKLHPDVFIGGNVDVNADEDWAPLLTSCTLSLTGHYPTDVYCGPDYKIEWPESVTVHAEPRRYKGISSTEIRERYRRPNASRN